MGNLRVLLSATLLCAVSGGYSSAQETATGGGKVELIEAEVTERTIEGELNACEFGYLLGYQDYIYSNGAVVGLRGSVSFNANTKSAKQPFVILKVTGFDFKGSTPVQFNIGYAYLSKQGVNFAKKEYLKFACEDGGLCIGYSLFGNPALVSMFSGTFEINYNREAGHSDVSVPINLDKEKPKEAMKFFDCQSKLIDIIKKKIQ